MKELPPCYRCRQPVTPRGECGCKDGICLIWADCRDVLPLLEPGSVGGIVTDPPYSSGGMFRGDRQASVTDKYVQSGTFAKRTGWTGDTMDQHAFFAWASLWLTQGRLACADGSPVAVFSDWRQVPVVSDAVQAAGWLWRGLACWHKPGIRMQRARFSGSAEYIVWGTSGKWLDHDGAVQNVYACAPVGEKEHVAEKPLDVLKWVLSIVHPEGTVCDPFAGTGTTGRACKDLGRKCIMVEIEEKYCKIAANRLRQEVLF